MRSNPSLDDGGLLCLQGTILINVKEIDTYGYQGYVVVKSLFSQLDIEKLTMVVFTNNG